MKASNSTAGGRAKRAQQDTPLCTIRMTADAATAAALRRLALRVCGDALEFVRVAVCAGSAAMSVWMCVRRPVAALLCERIARELPQARLHAGGMAGARA